MALRARWDGDAREPPRQWWKEPRCLCQAKWALMSPSPRHCSAARLAAPHSSLNSCWFESHRWCPWWCPCDVPADVPDMSLQCRCKCPCWCPVNVPTMSLQCPHKCPCYVPSMSSRMSLQCPCYVPAMSLPCPCRCPCWCPCKCPFNVPAVRDFLGRALGSTGSSEFSSQPELRDQLKGCSLPCSTGMDTASSPVPVSLGRSCWHSYQGLFLQDNS